MVLPMPLPLGVVVARHSKLAAPLPCGYGCHCKGAVGVLLQTQDGFVIGLAAGALSGSVLGPLDPLRRGAPAAETTATADDSASHGLRKQLQFQKFATQRFQDQIERLVQTASAVDADAELAQMQAELERQLACLSGARQRAQQQRALEEADAEEQWDQLQQRLDRLSPRHCVELPGDDLQGAFNRRVAGWLEREVQCELREERAQDTSPPTPPLIARLVSPLVSGGAVALQTGDGLPAVQPQRPRGLSALLARLEASANSPQPALPQLEPPPPPQPPELMPSPGPAIPRHQRSAAAKRERNRKKREKRTSSRHNVARPEAAACALPLGAVAPAQALYFQGSWKVRERMAATAFDRGVMAERAVAKERRGAKRLEKAANRRAKAADMRCGRRRRAARL